MDTIWKVKKFVLDKTQIISKIDNLFWIWFSLTDRRYSGKSRGAFQTGHTNQKEREENMQDRNRHSYDNLDEEGTNEVPLWEAQLSAMDPDFDPDAEYDLGGEAGGA